VIKAILTDIEGTTSSISFVHQVLFPYARAHLSDFIRMHYQDAAVRTQIDAVSVEVGRSLTVEEAIAQLLQWIDQDRKITALKSLQGILWEKGYRDGDFKGHLYEDAKRGLERWHQNGIKLYVYSSGSVYAQRLLFGFSDYGDLNPLFSGNFDTKIGGKKDSDSYRNITQAIGLQCADILFLSDIVEELDAAKEAGMQTCWLVREGEVLQHSAHPVAKDFDEVVLR